MKILIIDVYGKRRSTGRITSHQYNYFKSKGHDVKVCYRGVHEDPIDNSDYIPFSGRIEPFVAAFLERLTGREGHFHFFAMRRLKKIIDAFKPDIVQTNILHGYYLNGCELINYLKEKGIPVSYTMLDEYAYMGKCPFSLGCNQFMTECKTCHLKKGYPYSWFFDKSNFKFNEKKKAYDHLKAVFSGTKWVIERAKESALLKDKYLEELDEPIDYKKNYYPRESQELRRRLGIPEGNKVIVTVTVLDSPRKGGQFIYEAARALQHRKDITFVYVGQNAPEPYRLNNLIPIPFVYSEDELAEYYSLGDAFIWCSLSDTVPDACLEALGCGTPILGFAESGTVYVAPKELANLTPTYDIKALSKAVEDAPYKTAEISQKCRNYALSRYELSKVMANLENIYKNILNENYKF